MLVSVKRIVWLWLATCTLKQMVSGSSLATSYVQRRALCSNCPVSLCEAGGRSGEGLEIPPSPFPVVL